MARRVAREQLQFGAYYRLSLIIIGFDYDAVYPESLGYDPQGDEDILVQLIEDARNEWRPIWRCRRQRTLEPEEPVPPTERNE